MILSDTNNWAIKFAEVPWAYSLLHSDSGSHSFVYGISSMLLVVFESAGLLNFRGGISFLILKFYSP